MNYTLNIDIDIKTTKLGISSDYQDKCIRELYRLGDTMDHKTNVKAIMTSFKVWDETDLFNPLVDRILHITSNLFPFDDGRWVYKIDNCWGAIYKKGDYTLPHKHIPFYLSFVYYLQSNSDTPLVFNEGGGLRITPQDDDLIVFPSNLIHSVPIHEDEKDRICIAGNILLTMNNND